jgi:hypothetical protein
MLVSLLATADPAVASKRDPLIGTYSSLSFNPQSGDVNGYEVRIVPTHGGKQAVVQVAEGDAGKLYVVDVVKKSGVVEFEVPLTPEHKVKFSGRLTAEGLTGSFVHPTGVIERVTLKRSVSYWER